MPQNIAYYLSKGFDRKTAEYFAAGRRKVVRAAANDDFTLTLCFDNGETRLFDAAPLLQKGTVFEFLLNKENFRRVYVDEQHCVAWDIDPAVDSEKVWSNKVDLSSDSCYTDSVPLEPERTIPA